MRTTWPRKPKQRGRSRLTPDEGLARRYWKTTVCRGGCVMCRSFPVPAKLRNGRLADFRHVEGHHLLAKRHLRRNGFEHRLWDTRNGLALCRYHHARHELRRQPVPYSLVPTGALEFAAEVGLLWIIEREYPG